MMHQVAADLVLAGKDRHLQRVQGKAGAQVIGDLPADDLAGEQVGDKAVYANPQAVSVQVISATRRRFGAAAVKSRRSRSAGRCPAAPGTVVRGFFRLAAAPAIPRSRISRPVVHRATSMPSRRSCSHTFRAPYTRRPFFLSSHTRMTCSFSHSSRRSRGDGSCSRFFAA
jgi:hypothetical protein